MQLSNDCERTVWSSAGRASLGRPRASGRDISRSTSWQPDGSKGPAGAFGGPMAARAPKLQQRLSLQKDAVEPGIICSTDKGDARQAVVSSYNPYTVIL